MGAYDILVKFPFRKNKDYDYHGNISIRKLWFSPRDIEDIYSIDHTTASSMDFVSDNLNPSHKLFFVAGINNNLWVSGYGHVIPEEKKLMLEI